MRQIVGRGVTLVGSGVAVGIALAAVLVRLLSSVFFGVSTLDPVTFAGVAALLVGVAALACWIPAARAVAVEPAAVLRND